MSDYGDIKALAFDHYGTLFDKQAVAAVIEEAFNRGTSGTCQAIKLLVRIYKSF